MPRINTYLAELSALIAQTPHEPLEEIERELWATYQRDGTIIVCGNGGSASTASHFACDLAKWTVTDGRRRVRALALTDNTPVMLAWANDTGYDRMFIEQLMSIHRPGDTLVMISGSGNSPNVLRAVEWANDQDIMTIGLTGFGGGKLATLARVAQIVPSNSMPMVEDVHSGICHGLAVSLGEMLKQA